MSIKKTQINLGLLLPEVQDERDECVKRILNVMQKHKGVDKAHVVSANGHTDASLCFHYNPDIITLNDIQRLAQDAGATIAKQFGHLFVEVNGIREMNEADVLEKDLVRTRGVVEASVSATGNIRIEYEHAVTNEQAVLSVISNEGFKIVSAHRTPPIHKHAYPHGNNGFTEPLTQTPPPTSQPNKLGIAHRGSNNGTVETKPHTHQHEANESDDHANHEQDEHTDDDGHNHGAASNVSPWVKYGPVAATFILLLLGIGMDNYIKPAFFRDWVRPIWYGVAYALVGFPVAFKGIKLLFKGDVFTEFILMTIATAGAFAIGEYPEGVAVMLFYTVGELFQDAAVNRAKRSIKSLLDMRPSSAAVLRNGAYVEVIPGEVQVGETVQIKAGEKVPLDGEMLSAESTFNTAALTGESKPSTIVKGEPVLAGMINQDKVIDVKTTKLFKDSSLSRILKMVQEATTRKAKSEQFIRKFSRVYTPIVVLLAVCLTVIPYFVVQDYVFTQWLYRALIFLVISCPCALVISIPLGYFGGIGAAAKHGVLFKGSNFLDLMTKVNTVVMDKTGTLTKGVFKVQQVVSYNIPEAEWLPMTAALEAQSTHPVAQAVVAHVGKTDNIKVDGLEEISGHGLKGTVNGKVVLAGNLRLMEKFGVALDEKIKAVTDTIVAVAVDKQLAGYITIADEIKEDSKAAIEALHAKKIDTVMLSGDKQSIVDRVAKELGITQAYGDLLPEHKVQKVEEIKKDPKRVIAFVGDGINDAPVLALSDVGIAMGGLGSDAAIETADVIIQTDQPSRIAKAIEIGRATSRVVWQNIAFAFAVKAIVMILGAGGIATMWEAVFADVGVALLAILNAVRIQKMNFK